MIVTTPLPEFLEERGIDPNESDVLKKINLLRRTAKIEFDMETGPWIAGGSVLAMVRDESLKWKDLDIFFPTPERFKRYQEQLDKLTDSVEATLRNKEKRIPRSPYDSRPNGNQIYKSAKAYTYTLEKLQMQAQIIRRRYYSHVDALLGDFDFTVCMLATDGKLIAYYPQGLEDALTKSLRIHRVHRDSVLIRRFYKYIGYGYTPLPGQTRLMHEIVKDHPGDYAQGESNYTPDEIQRKLGIRR